jgi:hypothetical protein
MPRLGNKIMLRIYAKHAPYPDGHLEEVLNDMIKLGPPIIKCVEWRGNLYALEGSHRLAAAHYLGYTPIVNLVQQDWHSPEGEELWDSLNKYLPHYTWIL